MRRGLLLTRMDSAILWHCGLLLTRMDTTIPRHPSFLSVVTERKQRARLKGETNVFSLENPTSFIGNCFPFLSLELFRCDWGRNRVCAISIPSEPFDIIDLRATARTVGEWSLEFVSITGFVSAIWGGTIPKHRNFSYLNAFKAEVAKRSAELSRGGLFDGALGLNP